MKCPYCNQDHPDGTKYCPESGKPLSQLGMSEIPPVAPADESPIAEETVPGEHAGVMPEFSPLELTPPQVRQETGTELEQAMHPEHIEAQPTDIPAPEPRSGSPVEISTHTTAGVKPMKQRHILRWVTCGCVGIPLGIFLLLVLLVFVDPFRLHLWGRATGRYDAAAEVMPADTGIYLGINIGNALLTHVDRVFTPFLSAGQAEQSTSFIGYLPAPIDPRVAQQANPFGGLLQQIEDETGIKIPEDISPWVGQYAGIGAVEFQNTDTGSQIPTGWIIAVEARSLIRADAFLATLQSNLTDLQDINFERQTYKGVNISAQKGAGDTYGMAFGRSGRMVMVASSMDTLKQAIDRQANQSLSEEKDYTGLIGLRPRDWSASLYINHDWVGNMIENLMGSSMSTAMPLINPYSYVNWTGTLLNMSAIPQGVRIDAYVELDSAAQSAANNGQTQTSYTPPAQVLQMLPQDTVIYLANNRFDLIIQALLNTSFSDENERSYFLDSFEQNLGFSLQTDLLDQLTGQWALYAVPSSRGLLPNQMNLNLALNLLVQTDGNIDLTPISDGLNSNSMYSGIIVDKQVRDGVTYYEVGSYGGDNALLAFGAGNGYFTLGTDIETLHVSALEENSLTKSANYQIAVEALPTGMLPFVYVDLENLFANLREGMDASQRESFNNSISTLAPIRMIAMSSRLLQENVAYSSIVVILTDK